DQCGWHPPAPTARPTGAGFPSMGRPSSPRRRGSVSKGRTPNYRVRPGTEPPSPYWRPRSHPRERESTNTVQTVLLPCGEEPLGGIEHLTHGGLGQTLTPVDPVRVTLGTDEEPFLGVGGPHRLGQHLVQFQVETSQFLDRGIALLRLPQGDLGFGDRSQ